MKDLHSQLKALDAVVKSQPLLEMQEYMQKEMQA
jgi:hypothetical protein